MQVIEKLAYNRIDDTTSLAAFRVVGLIDLALNRTSKNKSQNWTKMKSDFYCETTYSDIALAYKVSRKYCGSIVN